MASDPTKPLLRLQPSQPSSRQTGRPTVVRGPEPFPKADQTARLGPRFTRLAQVLARPNGGLELRADPSALAPERLLVFEVKGSIGTFVNAINNVQGLELVDEEELGSDGDLKPVAYLMVPDALALRHIALLWQMWTQGRTLPTGFTPWRDVFACLRDVRPWGPTDRVQPTDADTLADDILYRADDEPVLLEVEIIFRGNSGVAASAEATVTTAIVEAGGRVISRAKIDDIAYHAVLAQLPVRAVRQIIDRSPTSLAGLEPVMYVRPQSIVAGIDVEDVVQSAPPAPSDRQYGAPILGILDGVPVAGHPLLQPHITLDDQFSLEPITLVSDRRHGTAMSSLIIHGDRNRTEAPLLRKIHHVPVMGPGDQFPTERLIVDLVYQAVVTMRDGAVPTAPYVIIINISLGNARRQFHGQLSPWARLLDRLAYRYGILFVVSAGNVTSDIAVAAFANSVEFESATPLERARAMIAALGTVVADRRLLSPSETVNGITVGARNYDAVSTGDRQFSRNNINPYPEHDIANPSSALGPGFANSVKPDLLMPGAREHLRMVSSGVEIVVAPAGAMRGAGLKVAAPLAPAGIGISEGYTGGTSAAAALASRTAHRIHDALELAYGQGFLAIPANQRAVLLKALMVHPAKWPEPTADLVKALLGPTGKGQAPRQKDNIRRFLGYGTLDADDAVACAGDRATFWAVGSVGRERSVTINVPVPAVIGGRPQPHMISATLAWFTPVAAGRKSYRSVRMKLLAPDEIDQLGVGAHGRQPDHNQITRGTVLSRCWSGSAAAVVTANMSMAFRVQREPDPGAPIDDLVPFGLAVTIAMPGQIELYEQVRSRLQPQISAAQRP